MPTGILLFQATHIWGNLLHSDRQLITISTPQTGPLSVCLHSIPIATSLKSKYDFEIKNLLWFPIALKIKFKFFSIARPPLPMQLWKTVTADHLLWRRQKRIQILALLLVVDVTSVLSTLTCKIRILIYY